MYNKNNLINSFYYLLSRFKSTVLSFDDLLRQNSFSCRG